MKRVKPMMLATAASLSLLFAATVAYGQTEKPEVPASEAVAAPVADAPAAEPTPDDPVEVKEEAKKEEPAATADDAKPEVQDNPAAEDPSKFAKEIWAKYKAREWLPLVGGILLMLVFVFRKFASKIHKFFDTKKGGYIVNLSTAGGVTFGLALWAGESIGISLVATAIGTAIAASGGYEILRDFVSSIFFKPDPEPEEAEDLT